MNSLAILERIVERSRPPKTPHSEDIERLLPAVQVRDDGEIIVSSDGREYAVQPGHGGDLYIGGHRYRGSDAEVVRGALCEILASERLPAPRWLLRAVLDRIALSGSHTADDIELLLSAVDLDRENREVVWFGTIVWPGDDGAVHVGDRTYSGPEAEAVCQVFREILELKRLPLPPWLQLPPTPPTPPTHMSVPGAFALVFGLLALAVCWLPLVGVLAFPLGFVALAMAAVAFHRIRTRGTAGRSLAIGGFVTGTIGLGISFRLFGVFLRGFQGPVFHRDAIQAFQGIQGEGPPAVAKFLHGLLRVVLFGISWLRILGGLFALVLIAVGIAELVHLFRTRRVRAD
ncbi:MAG: hypothetical protein ACRDZ4_15635 [Egibacteraceae bacterium]